MSPFLNVRSWPFFSSCLIGLPSSFVATSYFLFVHFGISQMKFRAPVGSSCSSSAKSYARDTRTRGFQARARERETEVGLASHRHVMPQRDRRASCRVAGLDTIFVRVLLALLLGAVQGRHGRREKFDGLLDVSATAGKIEHATTWTKSSAVGLHSRNS